LAVRQLNDKSLVRELMSNANEERPNIEPHLLARPIADLGPASPIPREHDACEFRAR
jgi:hypothetical protein